MAYGTDNPQGFVPINSLVAANPNMQFFEGLTIQSGYGNNIGMGDLVYVNDGGSIANAYDQYAAPAALLQSGGRAIGIFMGVYYEPPLQGQTPPIGSTGWQNAWYANSVTKNKFPARCRILTAEQQWLFSIQTGAQAEAAPTPTNPYPIRPTNFLQFVFKQDPDPAAPAGRMALNFDGTSTMRVQAVGSQSFQSGGAGTFDIVQFVDYAQDPTTGVPQAGVPYGNVLVRLYAKPYF